MIRQLAFVCVAALVLVSCKKDKNDNGHSFVVKAKVDGVVQDFNLSAVAQKAAEGKHLTLVAYGGYGALPFPTLSIYIENNAVISPASYMASDLKVAAGYATGPDDVYSSEEDFAITITSISATEVKGTFSGKVHGLSGTLDITEGVFKAKFE